MSLFVYFQRLRAHAEIMTSRSKEKVAAAFRRLFRGSEKLEVPGSPAKGNKSGAGPAGTPGSPSVASPSRRLLRCRDAVSPADFDFAGSQGQGIIYYRLCCLCCEIILNYRLQPNKYFINIMQ